MRSTIAHQFIKREEQEAVIKQLRLMDDVFCNVCFSNNIECTELLLNIILNREDLPETYVIFITENDIYHYAIPVYTFNRMCEEVSMPLHDGTHIVYVNGAYEGDSPIGKLMADFRCTESDKVFYPALRKQVQYFKENPEGVSHMCKAMEELQEKSIARAMAFGRAEGLKEGARRNNTEKACKMLKLGRCSVEEIAEVFGFTVAEVEALRENKSEIQM